MSVPPAARDLAEEAAVLIEKVGRSATEARRYRQLATTLAEPTFERALALGGIVRSVLRTDGAHAPALATAVTELETLLRHCEDAIAELRHATAYREAAAGFAAGAVDRVAALAPAIFTDVVAGSPDTVLYWPVPIAGRRAADHFVSPEACAETIHVIATHGLAAEDPPPALGADGAIRAVVLAPDADVTESPIVLAFAASTVPGPLCHLEAGGSTLYYAPRLAAPFAVRAAALVQDEWWAVRPDAYDRYLESLDGALRARDLRLLIEP